MSATLAGSGCLVMDWSRIREARQVVYYPLSNPLDVHSKQSNHQISHSPNRPFNRSFNHPIS